jgi:hypothetical protein
MALKSAYGEASSDGDDRFHWRLGTNIRKDFEREGLREIDHIYDPQHI